MSRNTLTPIGLTEAAAPTTPSAGTVALYAKSDHKAYIKDSTGVETGLAGGSTSPATDLFLYMFGR